MAAKENRATERRSSRTDTGVLRELPVTPLTRRRSHSTGPPNVKKQRVQLLQEVTHEDVVVNDEGNLGVFSATSKMTNAMTVFSDVCTCGELV